jgi:type VI protein secretion system component VasK
VMQKLPIGNVNAKAKQFCDQAANVFQRFPFNPQSKTDVSMADFIAVFQPGMGSLAMFYQNSLQDLLQPGPPFTRKPGAKVNVRTEFLNFFNQAAAVSRTFFPGNASRPSLVYTVQALPSNEVESFTFQSGSKALKSFGERQEFTWTGDDSPVSITLKPRVDTTTPAISKSGPWALFSILLAADHPSTNGTVYEYEFKGNAQFAHQSVASGSIAVLRLQIEAKGAPGLLTNLPMGCVTRVAQ